MSEDLSIEAPLVIGELTGQPPRRDPLGAATPDAPDRVGAVQRLVAAGPLGERVQRLVAHAAHLVGAPHAQISLISDTEQVVAATYGLPVSPDGEAWSEPASGSLCTVTVRGGQTLVVEDARSDGLVRHLPPVTSGAVGAYLGAVLADRHGNVVGSLCAYGPQPRSWTRDQVRQLDAVAELVAAELDEHTAVQHQEVVRRDGLAADAADLGTFTLHLEGAGRLRWDPRMCELHGTSPEQFDGSVEAFERLIAPGDLPRLRSAVARARRSGGQLTVAYRTAGPAGRERWLRARGRVTADMLGRPTSIEGTAYDATTEQGLRDDLYRLMETMPAALVRLSRDWTISYVNGHAETILGHPSDELVGRNIHDVVPGLADSVFGRAYATAMATGEQATVEDYFPPLDAWFEVRIWPDEDGLTLFNHDVSERARTALALSQTRDRLAVLAAAGTRLSGSLQPTEVLDRLAALLVPALACSVTVAVTQAVADLLGAARGNEPDRLHVVHASHVDPDREADLRGILERLDLRAGASSGLGHAVSTGRPRHVDLMPDELLAARADDEMHLAAMRRLNTGAQLTVPIIGSGRTLGALTVAGTAGQTLDEPLVVELTARGAVALENALSYARQDRAATLLQRALLPQHSVDVPGVVVATRYLPAAEQSLAGGDFFRTVVVGGTLVSALGDVMGHGTASAARAGQLHGLVAALALQGLGPGELLGRLSEGIDQLMDLELATLLVCAYDPASRRLTLATAGHPPPLVAPLTGEPYYVALEPGPPVGVATADYEERTVDLPRGSTVVMFSDGLIERRDESLTASLERLRTAVSELRQPPEAVADHVLRTTGTADGASDDVALLVMSHL